MLKGTVNFEATIKGNGVSFPSFEFDPNEPGVHKVEIEAPNGDAIRVRVHFTSVLSEKTARELAVKVNLAALNRIAFHHEVVIVNDPPVTPALWKSYTRASAMRSVMGARV